MIEIRDFTKSKKLRGSLLNINGLVFMGER